MIRSPRAAVLLVMFSAALAPACASRRVAGSSRPAGSTHATVVLLPDADDGTVGRARVSNPAGSVDLREERDSTEVSGARSPAPVRTLSEADVQRIFGEALAALPAAPRRFVLHFRFDSDDLTDQARALVPSILRSVTSRPVPDVVVVGHTDTAGARASNFALGLKRATVVRNLLVEAGLDASAIEVISHGETDLLLPTPDDTPEPRNRRVEIAVR
jgi:outer membrane protein OmpA-like peptidoglycan-associated protein